MRRFKVAPRPAVGRPANFIERCFEWVGDAALKGSLCRPPAALDRCSLPGCDTAPYRRYGIPPLSRIMNSYTIKRDLEASWVLIFFLCPSAIS